MSLNAGSAPPQRRRGGRGTARASPARAARGCRAWRRPRRWSAATGRPARTRRAARRTAASAQAPTAAKNCGEVDGDDVGPALEQRGSEAGRHERQEVERAQHDAFVAGDEGLHPNNAHAVARLRLAPAVLPAGEQAAVGKVGRAGDHGHLVTRPRIQWCARSDDARRRRVGLGREILGEEEDAHVSVRRPRDNATRSSTRTPRPVPPHFATSGWICANSHQPRERTQVDGDAHG